MKSLFIIALNIFVVVFLMTCNSSNSKRLEQALLFAGDNRGELEKVLTHYKNNPEKLEAARFLICNMPRWYGYEGWQLDSIKPVLIQKNKGEIVPKEVIEKWQRVSFYSLPKVYDAKVITADYLIENIDLAFDVWKRYPWNRSLGFDDFCELILPYRIGDEPLSSWRKLYHDHYTAILDSAYRGNDVIEACKAVDKELKRVYYRWDTDLIYLIKGQTCCFITVLDFAEKLAISHFMPCVPVASRLPANILFVHPNINIHTFGLLYGIQPENLFSSGSMSLRHLESTPEATDEKEGKSIVIVSEYRKSLSQE